MRERMMHHLVEHVAALTEGNDHAETIDTDTRQRRRVVTHHASLLDQLSDAVEPSATAAEGTRSGYTSAPSARLDAIDRLLAIDAGAAMWLVRCRLPLGATTPDNLRRLTDHARWLTDDDLGALIADVRSWVAWARTVTGWDTPPWRPDAPCPACEHRGGLRVRLSSRTAVCVDCGASWDTDGVEALGNFVRVWSTSHTVFN
jgi:hypothetical protein